MIGKHLKQLLAACALIALSACGGKEEPASGAITLSYASPYPPSHPFSKADIEWMQAVATKSGGRLVIKPFWSGSLISSDQSMVEIRHGVADIGLITPIYARGGAHALRGQAGFYGGIKDLPDQVAIYKCLEQAFPVFRAELEGLHVLAVQGGNFPGVLTRHKPIERLEDLRGLRLRAQTEALGVLRDLGADPVNMPMGEVYSALAKGVIDGVVAPADTITSLHFGEVAPYFTALHFDRGAYPARAMSDKAWQRLTPELRQVLMETQPVWEAALARQILVAEERGLEKGKDLGMRMIMALPPADQERFRLLYAENARRIADELAHFDVDGHPILTHAQELIAARARGETPACFGPENPQQAEVSP
ncbi:TRAP transporter substrate-binding protein DctP [Niveispirillum irakense]|uniref:TRAP transporter substrate-binding protein DctP n=1 Tax=Niveispirillum irakense TaxID=34011 RepID=UPI0004086790|nr:TRAP transporter substrate-binding protein DctP [Niveispirillum irakense]